jgi:transposase-like protein
LVELLVRYSKTQVPKAKRLPVTSDKPRSPHPLIHAARRRLTADERSRLAADYESGRSTTWLMRTYHLGKGTVLNILAEQGVKMRGQGIPADRLSEAVDLYESGLSLKAIAARLDCSAETVRQALIAAGVPMRARRERGSG